MRNIFITLFIAGLLSACGGDDSDQAKAPAATAPAASSASAPAPAAASEPGEVSPGSHKMVDGIRIVDHSRDEKEFELRRSINGVQSMIENAKQAGQDTAELETRLGDLQKQLKALLAG